MVVGDEVENYIRSNCAWAKLPKSVKQLLGNASKEYDKQVIEYSVKNQLRYRGNLIRHVKKNEEEYYEILLTYSRQHLMLYPYHLCDIIVRGLRLTPFHYYIDMLCDLIVNERSYDALPNFTAADVLRLVGIGRNQYIELMNKCRSAKKVFASVRGGAKRSAKELLPIHPQCVHMEPWWIVQHGCVMEDDVKLFSPYEKRFIDQLLDEGPRLLSNCDEKLVQMMFTRGLIYLDVPVCGSDYFFVPPLDGFVMNRVLGDYFEKLLYKIFVSIDEHTTITELSGILEIDLSLVKNAISVFCRLGIAQKKIQDQTNLSIKSPLELSLISVNHNGSNSLSTTPKSDGTILDFELLDSSDATDMLGQLDSFSDRASSPFTLIDDSAENSLMRNLDSSQLANDNSKRIGFLFDSTLTAFLMMGNLSANLKSHAVTLFEVGKLSDEALDRFLEELGKVENCTLPQEGVVETVRHWSVSSCLRRSLSALRNHAELDLLRCESLQQLSHSTRTRLLAKNYQLLVSMAPLSNDVIPVNCCYPPVFGPPIQEVLSAWFKLFIYELSGNGPSSLLLAKGTRLQSLPAQFRLLGTRLILSSWAHESTQVSNDSSLTQINDALQHSAVFIQGCSENAVFANISLDSQHPASQTLVDKLQLNNSIGYITTCDNTLFDCVLGLPLLDTKLNDSIIKSLEKTDCNLLSADRLEALRQTNRKLTLELMKFIARFQPFETTVSGTPELKLPYPNQNLMFNFGTVSLWSEYNN